MAEQVKTEHRRKTARIALRMTQQDKDNLQKEADKLKISLSAYLTMKIFDN